MLPGYEWIIAQMLNARRRGSPILVTTSVFWPICVAARGEGARRTVMAAPINLRVVDLYQGDRVASFQKAADSGIWGIIHKATTGATGKDGKYRQRRSSALEAGLLWGAYHWGTNADVAKQVDNFLKTANPDDQTLVALDFEDIRMTLAQARDFIGLVAQKLGRKPILYSGHLIKEKLGNKNDSFFGSHRLWLA
jgi:lysozyme